MTTHTLTELDPASPAPVRTSAGPRTALVTGASGYVGGQLVPALLDAGWTVRVLTRRQDGLTAVWADRVEVVEGRAEEPDVWDRALTGVDAAYFLLHSMGGEADFAARDRTLAQGFADAAGRAGVRRVVYLGGVHPSGVELSAHLASRKEVADILLAGPVPAVVLQAAVVLGAGSASYDMLRYLTGRLPAMIAPTWLNHRIQPIAIADVVRYLVAAPDLPDEPNRTFDIGGPEILTYAQLMQRYAAAAGLRRRPIVTVPVLTPRLASYWVGLVTPLSPGLATPLVESLIHDAVCAEDDILGLVPAPGGLVGIDDALEDALAETPADTGPRNLGYASAVTTAAAAVGSVFTDPNSEWYRSIDKPWWQPPAIAFPVVWTALYADIATSTASAMTELERSGREDDAAGLRRALIVNLVLNAAWSGAFFRLHRPLPAAVHAAVLAASSADLTRRTWSARPALGKRLSPYAAWTAFATVLNSEIARRNP